MLLWLFKQLARGSHRDWLLIENVRLPGLCFGWERLIRMLPRVQMQFNPPTLPSQLAFQSNLLPLLCMLLINTLTQSMHTQETSAYSAIYLEIPLRSFTLGLGILAQMGKINSCEKMYQNSEIKTGDPLQQLSYSPTLMYSSLYSHRGPLPVSEE